MKISLISTCHQHMALPLVTCLPSCLQPSRYDTLYINYIYIQYIYDILLFLIMQHELNN